MFLLMMVFGRFGASTLTRRILCCCAQFFISDVKSVGCLNSTANLWLGNLLMNCSTAVMLVNFGGSCRR